MKIPKDEHDRLKVRFKTRASVVFFVRLGLGSLCLCFALWKTWPILTALATASLLLASLAFYLSTSQKWGRLAHFASLCIDVAISGYVIFQTGGLSSPAMATGPIFSMLFALLFHSPIAVLPPLLILPLVSALTPQIGLLLFYGSLHAIVVYVTHITLAREEAQSLQINVLQKRLKEAAIVEERLRLSREIHDGVGAALSSIKIQSEFLEKNVQDDLHLKHELCELKHTAEEAIDDMRKAVSLMRDNFDLSAQLKQSCANFSKRQKIPVQISINGETSALTQQQQLGIFRILQEALNNAAKHSMGSLISVDVHFYDNGLRMAIRDNGKGFDPNTQFAGHYGLTSMKERARKLGGQIDIESKEGEGTTVTLVAMPI